VYQWVESFQTGRTNVTDEDCSGHLPPHEQRTMLNALVQEDRQIAVTDTANKLDIRCGFAYSIIHKNLKFLKNCARWVPKQLTDEQKWAHMEMHMQ
jgi:hypothetical protein